MSSRWKKMGWKKKKDDIPLIAYIIVYLTIIIFALIAYYG